jgi:hypothetical protein
MPGKEHRNIGAAEQVGGRSRRSHSFSRRLRRSTEALERLWRFHPGCDRDEICKVLAVDLIEQAQHLERRSRIQDRSAARQLERDTSISNAGA